MFYRMSRIFPKPILDNFMYEARWILYPINVGLASQRARFQAAHQRSAALSRAFLVARHVPWCATYLPDHGAEIFI